MRKICILIVILCFSYNVFPQIEGSTGVQKFNITNQRSLEIKKDTVFIVQKDTVVIEKPVIEPKPIKVLPQIVWNLPAATNQTTSFENFMVDVCIKSSKPIKSVSVYQNGKLLEEILYGAQEFRSECDFAIKKKIKLTLGQNTIKILAVNVDTLSMSEANIFYNPVSGKYYALIIGVEDYMDNKINDLDRPVKDASQLVELLTNIYTFEKENIIFLKNPTKSQIIQALYQYRFKITNEDNLMIFYAGHGYWDEAMQTGYWLPVDAQKDNPVNWFSNIELRAYIKAIPAKHTLLIADACFSGGIFKTRSAFSEAPAAISELMKLPSRKAMTSGTMTTVPDKSVFMDFLLKRLSENQEKFLPTEKLFVSFKDAVINNSSVNQVPQYGEIRESGDEGGDFIFIHK
ncbi:MAG: caspase family protein [Bacteroidales bacterium]|nr:caspase family protein [Bacteroidales bacterium]